MRILPAGLAVLMVAAGCESATGPADFRADYALISLQGKALPLPNGGLLLIGDSLRFNERGWPPSNEQTKAIGTIVYQHTDGSVELIRGYQSYQRRGDTVITSFSCRFSEI